jgi:predicted RNase H-like HicB family nuclease
LKQNVILIRDKSGWIVAECPELPGCMSQGKNEAEALTNIREAMAGRLWAEEQKAAESRR